MCADFPLYAFIIVYSNRDLVVRVPGKTCFGRLPHTHTHTPLLDDQFSCYCATTSVIPERNEVVGAAEIRSDHEVEQTTDRP